MFHVNLGVRSAFQAGLRLQLAGWKTPNMPTLELSQEHKLATHLIAGVAMCSFQLGSSHL